jgi:hypothetical protein
MRFLKRVKTILQIMEQHRQQEEEPQQDQLQSITTPPTTANHTSLLSDRSSASGAGGARRSSSPSRYVLSIQRIRGCVIAIVLLLFIQFSLLETLNIPITLTVTLVLFSDIFLSSLFAHPAAEYEVSLSPPSSPDGPQDLLPTRQAIFKLKIEYNPATRPTFAFPLGGGARDLFASHVLIEALILTLAEFPELLLSPAHPPPLSLSTTTTTTPAVIRFFDRSFSSSQEEEDLEDPVGGIGGRKDIPYRDLTNIFSLSLPDIIALTSAPPRPSPSSSAAACGIRWFQVLPISLRQLLELYLPSSLFHHPCCPSSDLNSLIPIATVTAIDPFPKSLIDYTFLPNLLPPSPLLQPPSSAPLHLLITNLPLSTGLRRRRRYISITLVFSSSSPSSGPSRQELFTRKLHENFLSLLSELNQNRQVSRESDW